MDIHKNIPIPPVQGRGRPPQKYPFDKMEVGDAISLIDDQAFDRMRKAATGWGKRKNMIFVSRSRVVDGQRSDTGGTVWRVE